MKDVYCDRCGEKLREGETSCPNCGAAAPEKPERAKSTGGKWLLGIGAAVAAAALAVLAAIFLPDLLRSDPERFLYYQGKLLAEPVLEAFTQGLETASGGLDTDLTVTAATEDPAVGPFLDGSSVTLKIRTGDSVILNLGARLMGGEIFSGALTYEDGVLGFWLPQAENVYYTADVSELASALGESQGSVDLSELDAGAIVSTVTRYVQLVTSVIDEDNLDVEKGVSAKYITLEGEVTGTLYTFRPSAGDVEDMILRLSDELEDDKELADLMIDVASAAGQKLGSMQVRAALRQLATVMRAAAGQAGSAVRESGFEWTLLMEGRRVRQILISAAGYSAGLELSGDGKESVFAAFAAQDTDGILALLSGGLSRKGGRSRGAISVSDGDFTVELEFDCEPKNVSPLGVPRGSYTLSVLSAFGGSRVDVEVEKLRDGSFDHTVTVPGDDAGLDGDLRVTVNATEKGTAEKPSAAREDISDYSEDELEELVSRLGGRLYQDLAFAIGDIDRIFDGLDSFGR